MSVLFRLRLAPGDRRDIEAVADDRFQSPRARRRCQALLLLQNGIEPALVHRSTSVTVAQQQQMLERLSVHGVQAAVFGAPRRHDQKRYDAKQISAVVADCLKRRPPPGSLSWNLVHLCGEVRLKVSGAEDISKERLRQIIKQELKISSIRRVDPFWLQQIRHSA